MPAFRDLFAFAAGSYASYRPEYPDELFRWLAESTRRRECAWDCGTGSGQAALALAGHFAQVVATDASLTQLVNARRTPGVHYLAMAAESAALGADTVDLVTVAQALHWFDRERFFAEVDHVLRPGGALAVWSYALVSIDPAIDAVLHRLYQDVLGSYWPAERRLVESGYADITLPYSEEPPPPFVMRTTWSLAQLGGYLSTWSAVGRYRAMVGADPLADTMYALGSIWGTSETRPIRWPLSVRIARKRV